MYVYSQQLLGKVTQNCLPFSTFRKGGKGWKG